MSSTNNHIDYTVLICTYNPDERLLKRCLNAVMHLDNNGISREVILADNNSTIPLSSLPYIQEYLEKMPDMQLLTVPEQGLTYARMAGIEKARGNYIVFFDDDNEPESSYLQELKKLHTQYPRVAAWGPGHVWVDFIDGVDKKIESYAKLAFQERHDAQTAFADLPEWQSCYPFGTGLCMNTGLLKEYMSLVKQGRFTLMDRKGHSLSSGGDTQMVLFGIHTGAAAGVSPTLKITHIIPGKRANHHYLKRIAYATSLCYDTCVLQVFPEYKAKLVRNYIPASTFVRRTFKQYVKMALQASPLKRYGLVQYIGAVSGNYMALNKPVPRFVKLVLKSLRINPV